MKTSLQVEKSSIHLLFRRPKLLVALQLLRMWFQATVPARGFDLIDLAPWRGPLSDEICASAQCVSYQAVVRQYCSVRLCRSSLALRRGEDRCQDRLDQRPLEQRNASFREILSFLANAAKPSKMGQTTLTAAEPINLAFCAFFGPQAV
ncbi:MAG: hypothetical protein EOS61_22530 [Mesorhizobium sp.]|nr:MAG: hypothetical protein EOS61_22530 [Mesorhizobium sp.]